MVFSELFMKHSPYTKYNTTIIFYSKIPQMSRRFSDLLLCVVIWLFIVAKNHALCYNKIVSL
jgi:hypothetical protein